MKTGTTQTGCGLPGLRSIDGLRPLAARVAAARGIPIAGPGALTAVPDLCGRAPRRARGFVVMLRLRLLLRALRRSARVAAAGRSVGIAALR